MGRWQRHGGTEQADVDRGTVLFHRPVGQLAVREVHGQLHRSRCVDLSEPVAGFEPPSDDVVAPVGGASEAPGRVRGKPVGRSVLPHQRRGSRVDVNRVLHAARRTGPVGVVVVDADVAVRAEPGIVLTREWALGVVLDRQDLGVVVVRRRTTNLPDDGAGRPVDLEDSVQVTRRDEKVAIRVDVSRVAVEHVRDARPVDGPGCAQDPGRDLSFIHADVIAHPPLPHEPTASVHLFDEAVHDGVGRVEHRAEPGEIESRADWRGDEHAVAVRQLDELVCVRWLDGSRKCAVRLRVEIEECVGTGGVRTESRAERGGPRDDVSRKQPRVDRTGRYLLVPHRCAVLVEDHRVVVARGPVGCRHDVAGEVPTRGRGAGVDHIELGEVVG